MAVVGGVLRRAVLAGLAAATIVVASSGCALAAEPPAAWAGAGTDPVSTAGGEIRLDVGPGRVVLEGPVGAGTATAQLVVHVSAPVRVRVTAQITDAALGASGEPVRAPLGSTDWTLGDVATITGNAFDYQPGFDRATFTVSVTARAPAFEQPRLGLVVVTAEPVAGAAGESATVASMVLTGPDAASAPAVADVAPALSADAVAIARTPWAGLDAAVGNPWRRLLDHGPATLTWRYENDSDVPAQTATTFSVWELGPLGWLPFVHDEGVFVRAIASMERVVLPGQQVTETLATDVPASSQPAWSLPAMGVVRITVRTTSTIAGLEATAAQESVVLVIAPWKEMLAGLVAVLVLLAALLGVRAGLRRVGDARRARVAVVAITPAPPAVSTPVRRAPPPVPDAAVDTADLPRPKPASRPKTPRQTLHGPPPKSGTPTV